MKRLHLIVCCLLICSSSLFPMRNARRLIGTAAVALVALNYSKVLKTSVDTLKRADNYLKTPASQIDQTLIELSLTKN